MTHHLTVHETYTEVSFDAPPGIEELASMHDLRAQHRHILLDLSGGSEVDINRMADLLATISDKNAVYEGLVTAILATDNLDYGLSQVFRDYRVSKGADIQVFREKNGAIAWLTSF
jgi:hypothetical protein